jgi:hypothetical protein
MDSEISLEEWLLACEMAYKGEMVLAVSLWETDGQFCSATGNLRLTDLDLEAIEEYGAGGKKKKAKAPAKASSSRKPRYEVPEEDDEDIEDEVEEEETEESSIPF